jgi:hypothetical protein
MEEEITKTRRKRMDTKGERMEEYYEREYIKARVKIPEYYELLESLKFNLPSETKRQLLEYYGYEVSNFFMYARSAKKPVISMGLFNKQGSQWICDFVVRDEAMEEKNEYNWHGQNVSQVKYNGCILYDERDGRISTHH